MPLDVDLEEIDPTIDVALTHFRQCRHRNGSFDELTAIKLPPTLGRGFHEGRPANIRRSLVKRQIPFAVRDPEVQVDIPKSVSLQQRENRRHRLDVDPMPTQFVKVLRDRMPNGQASADINVKSIGLVRERTAQTYIFTVLRIRDHLHIKVILI